MIVLLKLIIIVSIWVLGIKIATAEDMLLDNLGKWATKQAKKHKIFEALIVCPFCMPSIHSVIGYFFAFGLNILPFEWNWQLIIRYPLVVIGASIISGFTWVGYETINRIKEKNELEAEYYDSLFENKSK